MSSDKKKKDGKLQFVLIRSIGDVFVTDQVAEKNLLSTLTELSA
jgi:3-dehydroquinate synthetase